MADRPHKILFLVAGNAGHGKDTFAAYLSEITNLWTDTFSDAYAYGIKKVVHENYGVPWEILNADKDVKESTYVYIGSRKSDVTVRRALQKIGQFHRETFGATCWANAALQRAKRSNNRVCIITDARHPAEEIHWIGEEAKLAGFLPVPVRVRRSSVEVNPDHPSESLILAEPDESFSFIVENNGSLDDLKNMAEQVACASVLLQKTGKKKVKRKGAGWIVRHPQGFLPAEPLLTAEEADTLADSAKEIEDIPHSTQELVLDMLKGSACGS